MPRFILNRNMQANGDNEVHNVTKGCAFMPQVASQLDLGEHLDCHGAVARAKAVYKNARINGCRYCCPACHTS